MGRDPKALAAFAFACYKKDKELKTCILKCMYVMVFLEVVVFVWCVVVNLWMCERLWTAVIVIVMRSG